MKKILSVTLIVVSLLLFVSCNSDSDHGLYYQLANSYNKSSFIMSGFLGEINDSVYYYNSNGIYSYNLSSEKHEALVSTSAENGIISYAYISNDATSGFFLNRDGKLFSFNVEPTQVVVNKVKPEETFTHLWENGYITTSGAIYKVSDLNTNLALDGVAIIGSMIDQNNSDSIVYYSNDKTYIYTGSSTITVNSTGYCGFIKINSTYYLATSKGLYSVAADGTTTKVESDLEYTLQDDNKVAMYYDQTSSKLYLKYSGVFVVLSDITATTPTKEEVASGWAQGLTSTVVLNYKKATESGQTFIATTDSGLYKVDFSEKTVNSVF